MFWRSWPVWVVVIFLAVVLILALTGHLHIGFSFGIG
jgi:hypothetical protein